MLPAPTSYISIAFIFTTLLTFFLFSRIAIDGAPRLKNKIVIGLTAWLILQGGIAYTGVYTSQLDALPPRFIFAILPPFIFMGILFFTQKGRTFIDQLPLTKITWLNIVRIPVEMVLYGLFLAKYIPELMTFEGRNFDILAGITAPFVAYFGITKNKMSRSLLLLWNCISLGLLVFIIVNALLSAPTPFQQFAFNQPNIAVLHFPYIWLPSFIVPIVFFGHLVSIRQFWKTKNK